VTQFPLFLASVAGGLLFGMVGIHRIGPLASDRPGHRETLILLLKSIWPIALVLALSMVFGLDLILSLIVTVAILVAVHRLGPRQLWDLARQMPFGTVAIIAGALIFRRVLETSQAVEAVSQALSALGIPVTAIVFAIPFVAGLLTGLATPAFAIGFPIVLPLCGPDVISSGCGILAYAGGLAGLLVSPMHLCLALTRVYFKAEWSGVYRRIVPAALTLALTAALVVLVRR
jgi:hypothetical protein